jgi:hypothetical protein
MIKNFCDFVNEKNNWVKDTNVKKGKMHDILGVDDDKNISDVYDNGKELADALVKKVGKRKASAMINFAANVSDKSDTIFKDAQKYLSVNESIEENEQNDLYNSIYDLIQSHLETRTVPYTDDIDIDPDSIEKASKAICEFLKDNIK